MRKKIINPKNKKKTVTCSLRPDEKAFVEKLDPLKESSFTNGLRFMMENFSKLFEKKKKKEADDE